MRRLRERGGAPPVVLVTGSARLDERRTPRPTAWSPSRSGSRSCSRSFAASPPLTADRFTAMSVAAVLRPADYESRLQRYLFERSEEGRAVRVGEKEISEQAEIVARYADLFTREQLEALRRGREAAGGDEREQLYRLRKTCEAGLVSAELVEREDALENAMLAARVEFRGEELPLRTAQAQLAVLAEYADREELGALATDPRRPSTTSGWRCCAPARSSRPSCRASPTRSRVPRRRRASRFASSSAPWPMPAPRPRASTTSCARRGSSGCSGPSGKTCRRRPTSPTCAGSRRWRHLHQGACGRDLHGHAHATRLRPRGATRTSSSTSTTGRRSRRAPA